MKWKMELRNGDNLIISRDNKQKKEKFLGSATGVISGSLVGATTFLASDACRGSLIKKSFAAVPQFHDEFISAAKKAIVDKKLDVRLGSPSEIPEKVTLKGFWKILEPFVNFLRIQSINSTKEGKNAFFAPKHKLIAINEKLFTSPLFHEIGHVVNRTSKFWRNMKKTKIFAMLAPLVLFSVAMLTPKKTEQQKEKQGILGKTMTFIKENAGKLTLLATFPVWAEELRASLVGNKLAKKYLSGDMLKSALKTNKLSAMGYLASAGVISFSVYLANKVRDKIAVKLS